MNSELRKNTPRQGLPGRRLGATLLLFMYGCGKVLGISEYTLAASDAATDFIGECQTNRDCNHSPDEPAICRKPMHVCVALKSGDCSQVSGDYLNDDAIVIGSMFSFGGAQANASAARQNSAIMALDEINEQAGGIPRGSSSANARPLVLVSCDTSVDLVRAGTHLIQEIGVPAIVGPNASQDTLDLSRKLSVPAGTLVITPTAFASSIADLLDDGLTFQMVPTDRQRAPLMILSLGQIESQLKLERHVEKIKLGAVFRNDALGIGTRDSLNLLNLNGRPIADPINLGTNVRIDAYDLAAPDQHETVQAYLTLAPDIIVLAGTGELVLNVMLPLEAAWPNDKPRPYYMLTDALKVKDLLDAVDGKDDLRKRVRGTGVTPSLRSKRVFDAFRLSYEARYPGSPESIGMGPTYDATYAIAFALAATYETAVTGHSIALGLRQLAKGTPELDVQQTNLLSALGRLVMHQGISAIGTFGPLAWTDDGAVVGGTLEMWCVGKQTDQLNYQSSGMTLDLGTNTLQGDYTQCP